MRTLVPSPGSLSQHDLAARLLDEAVGHRQAQAGALPGRLGGEEGFEGARQHLGRHALAGVGHFDQDVFARAGTSGGSALPASTLAARMVSVPLPAIASRALMARFSSTLLSWLGIDQRCCPGRARSR